jgi:hypothetical protein
MRIQKMPSDVSAIEGRHQKLSLHYKGKLEHIHKGIPTSAAHGNLTGMLIQFQYSSVKHEQ